MPAPSQSLLAKAHYVPLALAAVYAAILGLTLVTAIQRELVFLHRVVYPFFPRYDQPEYYGIAPFKGRNIKITTPDGEVLGGWHILPHSVYMKQKPFPPRHRISTEVFDEAFALRPTVLYFHGNAATRASPHRIRTYMHLSTTLDCNVVAIDYRGFADSTGTPSQKGLIIDGRTTWNWVAEKIEKRLDTVADKQIIILAHSLGTGVATALTAELADAGFRPRALAMLAPFTSIPDLLSSFWLFGIIPILTPLKLFPAAQRYFKSHIAFQFNSIQALTRTNCPTLILHAQDDRIIPSSHSKELFEALVAPNGTQVADHISTVNYEGWGTIRQAKRDKVPIVWWEGEYGDHEGIGHSEGTMDLLAYVAGL